jgi:hypothetical protein
MWSTNQFLPSIRKNVVGDVIYSAAVNGRMVVVYEYSYTAYDVDGPTEENDVAIEFVDNMGNLQWQWPKLPYRWQLLDAIRYTLCGANDFLKTFLPQGLPSPQSVQGA